jgi:hypothetical protein
MNRAFDPAQGQPGARRIIPIPMPDQPPIPHQKVAKVSARAITEPIKAELPEVENQGRSPATPSPRMFRGKAQIIKQKVALSAIRADVEDLPSRQLPYGESGKVQISPYTMDEMVFLNTSKITIEDQIDFIANGIFCEGMESIDLTLPDFLYCSLARKLASLGTSGFRARYQCPNGECGHINETIVEPGGKLDFTNLEVPALPIKVDKIGALTDLRFMPITVRQYKELIQNKQDGAIAFLAKQCVSHTYEIAYATFRALSGVDLLKLKRVDQLLAHSLAPIEATCVKCGTSITVELDGWQAVILPFRRPEELDEDGITFGN